jgi:hypothetical protein
MKLIERIENQDKIFEAAFLFESLSARKREFARRLSKQSFDKSLPQDLKHEIIKNLHRRLSLIYLSFEYEGD